MFATTNLINRLSGIWNSAKARPVAPAIGGQNAFLASGAVGFAAGCRIATPAGEKKVEELAAGDLVAVLTNGERSYRPVRWIGRRRVNLADHPRPDLAAPVLIRRDAMADGRPSADVLLSPDHCLFIDERLLPVWQVINDMTIVQDSSGQTVHYYQVELEKHGILLVDGLPVESFLGTSRRSLMFDAAAGFQRDLGFSAGNSLRVWEQDACAPLADDPFFRRQVWQQHAERAERLGFTPRRLKTETDPRLHIEVAGKTIAPAERAEDRYVFVLPPGTDRIVLVSRAARPADEYRYVNDRRMLGIAVAGITLRGRGEPIVFPADNLPAGAGWHAPESAPGALWRWTDGAGELRFEPLPDAKLIDVRLSRSMSYIVQETPARSAS